MEQKPRDGNESLFNKRFSLRLLWQGVMVGALTLTAFLMGYYVLGGPRVANTMAFATLTFCQLFHAFDVRSEERSLFQIGVLSNSAMNKAFLVGLALQLGVLLFAPLQDVFAVVPLDRTEWLWVLGLAVSPVLICETVKLVQRSVARKEKAHEEFLQAVTKERERQKV